MSIIGNLIGGLGGKVVDAVSARSERKHQEKVKTLEIEEARHRTKLEATMRGQEMDNSWELEQIRLWITQEQQKRLSALSADDTKN